MVVKIFIAGISASKEVKKHQLRAQFLLDTYKIKYELVDITDPLFEEQRDKMLQVAKRRNESQPPQPPQFFNDDQYCGDYEDLEEANDNDELFRFLKLEEDITIENGNGNVFDENDLFDPNKQTQENGEITANNNDNNNNEDGQNEDNVEMDDEEEEVKQEIREQVTINGVKYDIPPDRKIMIGGRMIDVDELLAEEGNEVDFDKIDPELKEGLIETDTNDKNDNNQKTEADGDDEDEDEDDDDEEEEEEE